MDPNHARYHLRYTPVFKCQYIIVGIDVPVKNFWDRAVLIGNWLEYIYIVREQTLPGDRHYWENDLGD